MEGTRLLTVEYSFKPTRHDLIAARVHEIALPAAGSGTQ